MANDRVLKLSASLDSCINTHFKGDFYYNVKERSITDKRSGEQFTVTT